MENIKIAIAANGTTTLATAGKYCDRNVDVEVNVAGGGSGDLPEVEPIVLTGDQEGTCQGDIAGAYMKLYGDTISTQDLGTITNMFKNNPIEKIPFDLNCTHTTYKSLSSVFMQCMNLKELPNIYNAYPSSIQSMLATCRSLRMIPEDFGTTWDWSRLHTYTSANVNVFSFGGECVSLRKIPEFFLSNLWTLATGASYQVYQGIAYAYALDEVVGLPIEPTKAKTSNVFSGFGNACYRLKEVIFKTNDGGSPIIAQWKSQVIDLSRIGWDSSSASITDYNSGITIDKKVSDDASYQALKNDPDWFATKQEYSRYNHDSAVNTINSLPDTSAYLATAGGTNTIKFTGSMGSATDGGAISNLTEAEIAVAAAKGWTVTFV